MNVSKGPQYAFNKNSLHLIPKSKSQRPEILKDVLQSKTTVMLRFRLRHSGAFLPELRLQEENRDRSCCRGGIRTVSDQRKDDYLTLSIKLIGFPWFLEVCLWQFAPKANISFHVLERSHDPAYPCSIKVLLQLICCNAPIPKGWETDFSARTRAQLVCSRVTQGKIHLGHCVKRMKLWSNKLFQWDWGHWKRQKSG